MGVLDWTDIVTTVTFMTMANQWSIAAAKAEFSRVVGQAARRPQILSNRGTPVAVVVGIEDYQRMSKHAGAQARVRALLDVSAKLGAEGGVDLAIPVRRSRRDPFRAPGR